jgi:hypothetical protein
LQKNVDFLKTFLFFSTATKIKKFCKSRKIFLLAHRAFFAIFFILPIHIIQICQEVEVSAEAVVQEVEEEVLVVVVLVEVVWEEADLVGVREADLEITIQT